MKAKTLTVIFINQVIFVTCTAKFGPKHHLNLNQKQLKS